MAAVSRSRHSLDAAREALTEIIAEAPEASTYAQAARKALASINITTMVMEEAAKALRSVRANLRDVDSDNVLPNATAAEVESALTMLGERL